MALIKCNDCGKEISDTCYSCIHCGCPIEKLISCSKCGKEMNGDIKICPNCGNKLTEELNNDDLLNRTENLININELDKIDVSQKLKNSVAEVILIVGISIIIISFISGIIIMGNSNDELSYNSQVSFEVAIICWISGGISGLIFIGFSEIIKILHDIRRKLYYKK